MTNKKKKRKKELKVFTTREVCKKKMSKKNPIKPGKFIWLTIKITKEAESMGK
jgi:hypothetical protein